MGDPHSPLRAFVDRRRNPFAGTITLCLLFAVILSVTVGYELGRAGRLDRDAAGLKEAVTEIGTAQSVIWTRVEAEQIQLDHMLPIELKIPAMHHQPAHEALGADRVSARMSAAEQWMAGVVAGEHRLLASRLSPVERNADRVIEVAVIGAMIEVVLLFVMGFALMREFYRRERFGRRLQRAALQRKLFPVHTSASLRFAAHDAGPARIIRMSRGKNVSACREQLETLVRDLCTSVRESERAGSRLILEVESADPEPALPTTESGQTADPRKTSACRSRR